MFQTLLLQASGTGGGYSSFLMLGGMVAIFYFFFIRPQQKKQKETKKFIEEIGKGDQVVTMGGIHGKIVSVENDLVTLDVDRGTKLVIEKSSISLDSSKRVQDKK
jgi:preprotein translocase subunit YajC